MSSQGEYRNEDTSSSEKFTPQHSYSTTAQSDKFPKRDQAIIVDTKDGISLTDYITSIGSIVSPQNIIFASKISQGRVSIFLSSKEIAEKLVYDHPEIKINEQTHRIRLLLARHKKVIISNACPSIPHNHIEQFLKSKNIRCFSEISFLHANVSDPAYKHVQSSRRQVFVHPDDICKIPPSFLLDTEDATYRIFFTTTEILRCFICLQNGHVAKECPTPTTSEPPRNSNSAAAGEAADVSARRSTSADGTDSLLNDTLTPCKVFPSMNDDSKIPEHSSDLQEVFLVNADISDNHLLETSCPVNSQSNFKRPHTPSSINNSLSYQNFLSDSQSSFESLLDETYSMENVKPSSPLDKKDSFKKTNPTKKKERVYPRPKMNSHSSKF